MTEQKYEAAAFDPGQEPSLWSLFFSFLKIGSTTFGGFMALVSAVQNHAVHKQRMLRHEDMLDGISLATVLPGPVAFNVVAYVGYRVRGWMGALASVLGVSLPSFILMVVLSYLYFTYGQLSNVEKIFKGFMPAVAAVIVSAAWSLGAKTIKGLAEGLIAAVAFLLLLNIAGFYITVGIISGAGITGWLLFRKSTSAPPPSAKSDKNAGPRHGPSSGTSARVAVLASTGIPLFGLDPALIAKLSMTFAGMSLLLFGGGYVFIPLMQRSVVETYGWVTHQEFIDGIALGQIMPGPILISSAFIGYKVAGLLGALAAAVGMFGPPAVLMLICTRFLDRIKGSLVIAAALRGVRPAVIGMIAAAAVFVGRISELNLISASIFCASLIAIMRFQVGTVWIIPASGILGLLLY